MIDQLLVQVANFIAGLAQNIALFAQTQIGNVVNWLAQWATAIFNHFNSLFVNLINWLGGVFASITGWISKMVLGMENLVITIINRIVAAVQFAINGIAFIVNNVVASIQAGIANVINTVRSWIDTAVGWVKSLVTAAIDAVKSAVMSVITTVQDWIKSALNFVVTAYNAVLAKINLGIDQLIGSASKLITAVNDRLVQLKDSVVAGIKNVLETVPDAMSDAAVAWVDELVKKVEAGLTVMDANGQREIVQTIDQLLAGKAGGSNMRQLITRFGDTLITRNPRIATIFFMVLLVGGAVGAIMPLMSAYAQPIVQEIGTQAPYQVLSPIDAAAAWRRGFITEQLAVDIIRKAGHTPQDAQVILKLADTVPAEFELVAMELRGIVTPAETDAAMRIRGFDPQWSARIRQLGQVLPPVQDLITMAVREAFSPDVAARFGQFEDFPQAFADEAKKQGLSVEWARRYWAAHWSLPSPMQGFEMFQRRIISEDDLKLLLRALDIMPFWRDNLIKLSYNPLTRVDVRRMHQLGVLNDNDVYNSYLDIGYSPENAARLQDFTLKLNKGNQPLDDEELGRLTRAQVLNFYEAGLIDQAKALAYLTGMGITPDAAILYIRSVDANEQLAIRKADADFIVEQAQAGVLTFSEAQDKLNNMGLEAVEVKRAINKLVRLLDTRTKLPSKAEALSMWKADVITEAIYRDVLGRLGYAEYWVNAFIALERTKSDADRK
jgi:hypothetical protein